MASSEKVKLYLASWFQLGKKLVFDNGQEISLAHSIIKGDRFSDEFEACWQKVIAQGGTNCHLEGTETNLDALLSPAWDIFACARCNMPIPRLELGVQTVNCPCVDMPQWPNLELPLPRAPINSNSRLANINNRLMSKNATF
ncbi:conserved hypothetical protein [Hyella patelloides LEGE 07179]|uniref:Uncharacterized protein n=1 Tax=Hyella patelloides LEGE 07179 TaxID=945734 RepID=A0A563VIN5_9CYAN|nr:hypothetical protein [Hyella patelloides]VEP11282.1 conserved hypothetical protein [Hyella patelloides LEGE 07179]